MNNVARMIMQHKMQHNERDGTDAYDDYARGYRDGYDRASYEIHGDYAQGDGARRRSKTTGRYMSDRDGLRLSNKEIMDWEHRLKNADGTTGKHFEFNEVMHAAEKLGIMFDEYSEKEFCMVMNMLYSDLCEVCRASISPDKEAIHYAKMAKAWLEDKDGPPPSEKLALYFHCIADN